MSCAYAWPPSPDTARIFAEPLPADLRWTDFEALLRAAGAETSEGAGSRVGVSLAGVRAVFDGPQTSPAMKRGAVRAVRAQTTATSS